MKNIKKIIITGASSGIGAALARNYACNNTELFLLGRNQTRLEEVAIYCRQKGSKVNLKVLDVRETSEIEQWLVSIFNKNRIDIVFANAGISGGTSKEPESDSQTHEIFEVNLIGVLNTILPTIPFFINQRRGQIVIISSLASYLGLPSCPAYSASKAAIRVYGEALRGILYYYNVGVTVVTPGYIKTPMTDVNTFKMPFLISADKAANIIITRLRSNPARIVFPFLFYMVVKIVSFLPINFVDFILRKLPGKPKLK